MTTAELRGLTVTAAAEGLRSGLFTAVELETACRQRLTERESDLHAYLQETPSLSQAQRVDDALATKSDLPKLAGIPVAVKDNLTVRGVETTAGSKILKGYQPVRDATAVARLRAALATIIGKTNLDEFAMGSSTENSAFGPTRNPYDLSRVPGGSSGGSAAAVASGSCLFALGTDTGGSVRQPAAFCGLVGLKPTYGRVSRSGLIALTSSTDVVGVLAKSVADAAVVLQAIAGRDPDDATTAPSAVPDYSAALPEPVRGLRIGVPKEYFAEGLDREVAGHVRAAIDGLESAGAIVESCSLPSTELALWVYYIVTPAEASTNLARYDGIRYPAAGYRLPATGSLLERYAAPRGHGFGPEPKRRILLGTFALSAGYYDAYYDKAQRVRRLIADEFSRAFDCFDLLATPATPTVAFPLGAKADPLAMYLQDIYLVGASLAGLPAVSVPCGVVGNLPVGLQLIGRPFDEATVLRGAARVEAAVGPLPVEVAR